MTVLEEKILDVFTCLVWLQLGTVKFLWKVVKKEEIDSKILYRCYFLKVTIILDYNI